MAVVRNKIFVNLRKEFEDLEGKLDENQMVFRVHRSISMEV